MPNRMLRDWTGSDKMNSISVNAERFFIRLIMKVDDHGCFYADTRLLKANLFPLLLDNIREADLTRWMAECQKAGLIVLYENTGKKYVQILDFRQRLDKARSKYPLPDKNSFPESVNEFPTEAELEAELEKKKNTTPKGAEEIKISSTAHPEYSLIKKDKVAISDFIKKNNPEYIEPYAELWNLFADERSLTKVSKLSDSRKRKFKVRIREKGFDFLSVLKKASQSEFLLTGKWFGFDWIIENDSNYLKIIEGAYDKNNDARLVKVDTEKKDIDYMFERYCDGELDRRFILPSHFEDLKIKGLVEITKSIIDQRIKFLTGSTNFTEGQLVQDYEAGRRSKLVLDDIFNLQKLAVIEYFKKLKESRYAEAK